MEPKEAGPLCEMLDALDHLEPEHARYLAAFAYLLGRIAHADDHMSPAETRLMEELLAAQAGLAADQARLVVQLAKASSVRLGATADFLVAREFSAMATYEQKLSVMRCLFALAAADTGISISEEGELHRVAGELKIDRQDLVALRVANQRHLPGLSGR